ncbi:MAG: hypothetical protein ACRD2L_04175, partial [Terriglobia bacterium]
MLPSIKLACGQILGLVLLWAAASAHQQSADPVAATKSASFAIAEKAFQWMPESFRRVMSRNLDSLRDGINEIRAEKFVMPPERLTLEEEALRRMTGTVSRLQSRPKFSEIAKDFGALSQMMLLLNLPETEADSIDKLLVLEDVIGRNSQAFRIVVYDAAEIGGGRDEVRNLLDTVRQRRKKISERFAEVQSTHMPVAAPASLDPRSPLYGIAALVYSHAINDTARTWLWIWMSANGDMSGRPSLQAQP